MSEASPIGVTLGGLDIEDVTLVAGRPTGDGWVDLERIREPLLADWLDFLRGGEARQRSDVAGTYLASWLADAVVGPVAAAALDQGRAWPVVADRLAVHRHEEGWFDGFAVRGRTVWVLPGDPLSGHPHASVVADRQALYDRIADGVITVLDPIFAAIRARTRVGLPAMWGSVGDNIASAVVDRARNAGSDGTAEWRAAQELIDVIAARRPRVRTCTSLAHVAWSGGSASFAVRGTCCLSYQVSGLPLDRDGEAYCTRCPLRDPADRERRWSAWLEDQAMIAQRPGAVPATR